MTYRDYDRVRYVYETEIRRYEQDALAKAVQEACTRSLKWHDDPGELGFAFRVVDNTYSSLDEWDEAHSRTALEIIAFPVVKETETGFRICRSSPRRGPGETRWIAKAWNKQWASRTPEDALRSYIARRKKMARIYEARAQTARSLADRAEYFLQKDTHPLCP